MRIMFLGVNVLALTSISRVEHSRQIRPSRWEKNIGRTTASCLCFRSGTLLVASTFILFFPSNKSPIVHPSHRDTHCLHHHTHPKSPPESLVENLPQQLKTTTSATSHPLTLPPTKSPNSEPEPGIWNVHHLGGTTHVSIMPFWTGSRLQREFWSEYGDWLRNVETTTVR